MITLTSADLSFTLQGRTGMAETESGSVTNATVFTAFGADENGIRVFVGLDPNTNDSESMSQYNFHVPQYQSFAAATFGCCFFLLLFFFLFFFLSFFFRGFC